MNAGTLFSRPLAHIPRLAFMRGDAPRTIGLLTLFVVSFCMMTIELVAGRVMAPYMGVSLYTWTGAISVVLIGVTVGNALGGWLADSFFSRRVLSGAIFLGGCSAILVPWLAQMAGSVFSKTSSLSFGVLLFAGAVFFPVACFLSMVSPHIAKFALHGLKDVGSVAGSLGAASAAGSVIGTLASGFLLLMYVGTRSILFLMGGCLIVLAIATFFFLRPVSRSSPAEPS